MQREGEPEECSTRSLEQVSPRRGWGMLLGHQDGTAVSAGVGDMEATRNLRKLSGDGDRHQIEVGRRATERWTRRGSACPQV